MITVHSHVEYSVLGQAVHVKHSLSFLAKCMPNDQQGLGMWLRNGVQDCTVIVSK